MSQQITNYVVAFLFNQDMNKVWLIRKQKPEWQKGCLNGIGGKIEEGETAMAAMIRELKEESGGEFTSDDLFLLGEMKGTNNDDTGFKVSVFTGTTDQKLVTKEVEEINAYFLGFHNKHKHIGNVPMLIEACLYKLRRSSNFKTLIMNY